MVLDPHLVLWLSTLAIRNAVRAGANVALFASHLVRDAIAAGSLVSRGVLVGEALEF